MLAGVWQEGICQLTTVAQSPLGGHCPPSIDCWSPLTNVNGEMGTAVKGSFTCATSIYPQQVICATGIYICNRHLPSGDREYKGWSGHYNILVTNANGERGTTAKGPFECETRVRHATCIKCNRCLNVSPEFSSL